VQVVVLEVNEIYMLQEINISPQLHYHLFLLMLSMLEMKLLFEMFTNGRHFKMIFMVIEFLMSQQQLLEGLEIVHSI
jgi:hypothetical protein